MTPGYFKNWLYSIEHQYGRRKCEALACNLLHRSTIVNVASLQPSDVIDIHHVINAFEAQYEGGEITMSTFQKLLDYYQMIDGMGHDLTTESATLNATVYLLKILLGIPILDGAPAWIKSVLYSMEALRYPMNQFMTDTEFFLEHLE